MSPAMLRKKVVVIITSTLIPQHYSLTLFISA